MFLLIAPIPPLASAAGIILSRLSRGQCSILIFASVVTFAPWVIMAADEFGLALFSLLQSAAALNDEELQAKIRQQIVLEVRNKTR